MAQVKVTVLVEVDGVALPGFPFVSRLPYEQVVGWNPYDQAENALGVFESMPLLTLDVLQALVLRTSGRILVRFNGQSDAGLELEPGGLLIALGAAVEAGSTTNVRVSAMEDTSIRGVAAGAAT